MQVIISSLLLIFALHFLLRGINSSTDKESFSPAKADLLEYVKCNKSNVVAASTYTDDKNDPNFQSNVLNVNRFYKKNIPDELEYSSKKPDTQEEKQFGVSTFPTRPDTWKYKNELVMNGGELLEGVTGYDTDDQYIDYTEYNETGSCQPSNRGATINDDMRMGLGALNEERRSTT